MKETKPEPLKTKSPIHKKFYPLFLNKNWLLTSPEEPRSQFTYRDSDLQAYLDSSTQDPGRTALAVKLQLLE